LVYSTPSRQSAGAIAGRTYNIDTVDTTTTDDEDDDDPDDEDDDEEEEEYDEKEQEISRAARRLAFQSLRFDEERSGLTTDSDDDEEESVDEEAGKTTTPEMAAQTHLQTRQEATLNVSRLLPRYRDVTTHEQPDGMPPCHCSPDGLTTLQLPRDTTKQAHTYTQATVNGRVSLNNRRGPRLTKRAPPPTSEEQQRCRSRSKRGN
jgi:hypothetical protein